MTAPWPRTLDELAAENCRFDVDRVSGRPDVTEFKRRARWQQAFWRQSRGIPLGSHTSGRVPTERPNGSRVELSHAKRAGCNFLSPAIRAAAEERVARPEPHQMLDADRLWADLLSSMPMCFNLFGELHGDPARLDRAVGALWPDHPGDPTDIRFEWSPGRRDPLYLGNRSAFDAVVLLALPDGSRGAIGIETKYHEDIKPESAPTSERFERYRQVTESSGAFSAEWEGAVVGTDLQQLWLDHLLALSMLQHSSGEWSWARFVVVYPVANPSVRDAVERYERLLVDSSTFEARTIEQVLDTHSVHDTTTEDAFRHRYLWKAQFETLQSNGGSPV